MTGLAAALAVAAVALVLLALTERVTGYEARWVRRVAAQADPPTDPVEPDAVERLDLGAAEEIPEAVRSLCPPPPFTALAYHHTCGSCRALWAAVTADPDLADLVLVHDAAKADRLRELGVYRLPAVALPEDVMDGLPSGLALRVDADWRIAEVAMVDTVADLRRLHGEMVAS